MSDKGVEYWRWSEYRLTIPKVKPEEARVITAGIDVGSVSSKAVVMVDGEIYALGVMRTGSSSPDSARKVLEYALEGTGLRLSDINYIVGTGYGRVNVPMANSTVTEIACHAKGANYIWGPSVRTILDVGGQDIKAIKCDEKGRVLSFLMNDKCAAGTGRFIEGAAKVLGLSLKEVGELSLKGKKPVKISSTCAVFAETETMEQLAWGNSIEDVLYGVHTSMAVRSIGLLRRVGIEPELTFTGGVSQNVGMIKCLEEQLNMKVNTSSLTMYCGAIGAALFGLEKVRASQLVAVRG